METRRELLCKGYLRKSPPETKMEKNYKWRKRYFKLWSDRTLEYYKNEYEPRPLKEPLDLGSCMAVLPCNDAFNKYIRKDYPWLFSLAMPGRCYHFSARTEGEMITWKREISKMCSFAEEVDGDAETDQPNGFSDIELPRTISVSSQSQHSTSSASSKSSPSQWRADVNVSDVTSVTAASPYRTSSISSKNDRVSFRSPDLNGRHSSISSQHRPQTPRSPESPRPKLSTGSPLPSMDMDGNYDVLRSPVRALDDSAEAHYDVPPPASRLQHLSYKGRSVSLKQANTSGKSSMEAGYVDMKPKEDDYLEYENDNEEEQIEKKFLSPPWMNGTKAKSLKARPNVLKSTVPKRTNTVSLDNGFHHQPVILNEPIHDKIPDIKDKTVKEVVSLPQMPNSPKDPPKVDRGKKPPPKIDRRKKPSLQNESYYQHMEEAGATCNGNGMFAITRELNSTHINNSTISRKHSSASDNNYFNTSAISAHHKHDSTTSTNNYDNLPSSPIRYDVNGQKLTVGTPAHINLQLGYAWEPLPPNPSESDEPSSPASPYENTNEVFLNLHEESVSTNYENVDALSKEEIAALTYSQVEASWINRHVDFNGGAGVGEQAGSTGTHYVFVDIPKSAGLKMSKRSMEIGLAD